MSDALPKLQGLAVYAENHASAYRRIESVAEVKGQLRVLDLTKAEVRQAIIAATDVVKLFSGPQANDY